MAKTIHRARKRRRKPIPLSRHERGSLETHREPQSDRTSAWKTVARAVGEIVRRERSTMRLSQQSFALLADVARTYFSEIVSGSRQPTLVTIWKIADALNMEPSQLVMLIEKPLSALFPANAFRQRCL